MSRHRSNRRRYESSRRDDRSPSRYSGDKHGRRGRRGDGTSDSEEIGRRGSRRPDRKYRSSRRHSEVSEGIYSDDNRGRSSRGTRRGKDEEDLKHYINLIYKEFKAMLIMVNDETEIIKKHPAMTKAPRTTRSLYEGKMKIPKRLDDSEDATALDMIKELENGIQEAQDKLNKSYRNRFFKQVKSGMERNPNPSYRALRTRYSDNGSRDGSDLDNDYEPRRTGKHKYRDERGRKDRYGEDKYRNDRRRGDRHEDRRRKDRYRDNDRNSRRRYGREY